MADTADEQPPTPAPTPEPSDLPRVSVATADDSSTATIDPEAARRRAISDLLFFCKSNDLDAVKEIVSTHNFDLADTSKVVDYDMRTPLHLAATGGAWRVTHWLLHNNVDVNALDGFGRTPLDDALKAGHAEVAELLADSGGRVVVDGHMVTPGMVMKMALASGRSQRVINTDKPVVTVPPEWEIERAQLRMDGKLGEGEFGVVYRAGWNGTPVAAKVLKVHNITLGDLRTEVSVLRRVHHPNVVQFLGACVEKPPYILVTELMYGGSLQDALDQHVQFSVRRALEMALDCARGMAYLHDVNPHSIIHRDLKPQNLMLAGHPNMPFEEVVKYYGSVKIADFGLSKTLPIRRAPIALEAHDGGLKHQATSQDYELTGQTGSYRYMAPEVFKHKPYNAKVDVYSFSMVLYQMLFKSKPLAQYDALRAAKLASLHNIRPQLPSLDDKNMSSEHVDAYRLLVKLLQRCWAPKAADRPAFPEICATLEKLIKLLPADLVPPTTGERSSSAEPGHQHDHGRLRNVLRGQEQCSVM